MKLLSVENIIISLSFNIGISVQKSDMGNISDIFLLQRKGQKINSLAQVKSFLHRGHGGYTELNIN